MKQVLILGGAGTALTSEVIRTGLPVRIIQLKPFDHEWKKNELKVCCRGAKGPRNRWGGAK